MVEPAASVEPGLQCRPRHHTLSYHGGDLIQNVAVFVIFWGSEWQHDAEHQAAAEALRAMYQKLSASEYGCSLREFALPGMPLGAGSYAGDEIITSAPVGPGQELSDGAIQARILTEVHAHRAPAVSDDVLYVVVPPNGVPVLAGGETGCGGSHFTFCGYHDAFTASGHRYRYAVLPYPCSSQGGTCFVDSQESVARSLQAVGSHELAEAITDPDDGSVGASAWWDDRTGDENADICASDACVVDLPVGTDTFAVNSLWSNLGRNCVAGAPCTLPAPACTDPAPGACVANAHQAAACSFEWHVEPNLTRDRSGLAGNTVSCADGEPFCDADGAADGHCTFRLAVCLNSDDPRLACSSSAVDSIQLRGTLARSSDPNDQANAAALVAALQSVDPHSTGAFSQGVITYTPASTTTNTCSSYTDIIVPIRTSATQTKAGARKLQVLARSSAGKLSDKLTLVCTPTFP
jgi:hypothetical protein